MQTWLIEEIYTIKKRVFEHNILILATLSIKVWMYYNKHICLFSMSDPSGIHFKACWKPMDFPLLSVRLYYSLLVIQWSMWNHFVWVVRSNFHGSCFFNDEPTHLGYRDLDYILAGKSTILILIDMFPWSASLVKSINSLDPSRRCIAVKCNFLPESLIATSFLTNHDCVLLYSCNTTGATADIYLAGCTMLSVPTGILSGFLKTWPVINHKGLSCSSLPT